MQRTNSFALLTVLASLAMGACAAEDIEPDFYAENADEFSTSAYDLAFDTTVAEMDLSEAPVFENYAPGNPDDLVYMARLFATKYGKDGYKKESYYRSLTDASKRCATAARIRFDMLAVEFESELEPIVRGYGDILGLGESGDNWPFHGDASSWLTEYPTREYYEKSQYKVTSYFHSFWNLTPGIDPIDLLIFPEIRNAVWIFRSVATSDGLCILPTADQVRGDADRCLDHWEGPFNKVGNCGH